MVELSVPTCPECGSTRTRNMGRSYSRKGISKRSQCLMCGRSFKSGPDVSFEEFYGKSDEVAVAEK